MSQQPAGGRPTAAPPKIGSASLPSSGLLFERSENYPCKETLWFIYHIHMIL